MAGKTKKKESVAEAGDDVLAIIAKIDADANEKKMQHVDGVKEKITAQRQIIATAEGEIEKLQGIIAKITGRETKSSAASGGGTKLKKNEMAALREIVLGGLTKKVKQVDYVEEILSANPQYKKATVVKILTDARTDKMIRSEPVLEGAPLKGIYLMPK